MLLWAKPRGEQEGLLLSPTVCQQKLSVWQRNFGGNLGGVSLLPRCYAPVIIHYYGSDQIM